MTLLSPESPHAIIMVGIPGAGKSAFAEHFAETFKALIVSQSSLQRKYMLSDEGAKALQDDILREFMKTHKTILVDGGYDIKADRDDFVRSLVKVGYRPLLVWVQTDTGEASRRALRPYPRGSGMSPEEFDIRLNQFDPPADKERSVVISGKHTYASQLKIVLRQLATTDNSQPRLKPIIPPKLINAERITVTKGKPARKQAAKPETTPTPKVERTASSDIGRDTSRSTGRHPYSR